MARKGDGASDDIHLDYIVDFQLEFVSAKRPRRTRLLFRKDAPFSRRGAAMNIGSRIREWRERKGWSMPYMADQLGIAVTAQTLGRYERGERLPDSEFLEALVRLGCDPSWLLTDVAAPSTKPAAWARFTPDAELLGRVTDMIARVHKESGAPLSMVDLGRLSAEKYNEIANASDDENERFTMVKLLASQIRNELTNSKAGSGKRSA